MPKIQNIKSRKIINSRAVWTIETSVELTDGSIGVVSVPDGASKGENEAVSLSAELAVSKVENEIFDALKDVNPYSQSDIDNALLELDGTNNKSNLGGNSILSVSMAVCRAVANSKNIPLYEYISQIYFDEVDPLLPGDFPTPVFNILNGGLHAGNNLSFQEFMVIPGRHISFDASVQMGLDVYQNLYDRLKSEDLGTDVGNEGGFAPSGMNPKRAFEYVREAAMKNYSIGEDIFLGTDVAAGSFYKDGKYHIKEEGLVLDYLEFKNYCADILKSFEIIYFEDPFYEQAYDEWEDFGKDFLGKTMLVADDLAVTNTKFLEISIKRNLANAVIVKPNQVGTLTETFDFVRMARKANMSIIVSHRSGDTTDDFIADLALGVRSDFIKSGAPARGERVAKYNRLLDVFNTLNRTEL